MPCAVLREENRMMERFGNFCQLIVRLEREGKIL